MRLSEQQEARLARFARALGATLPRGAERDGHLASARRFELYLMGRGLPFSEGSFRTYLLEMHRVAAGPKEERDAEQARLKKYYHSFRAELAPDAAPPAAPEEIPAAAPPPPGPASMEPPARPPPPRRPSAFEGLPAEEEILCPKCGFRQPRADACASCGIVYEKWKRSPSRGTGAVLQQIETQLGLRPSSEPAQPGPGLSLLVVFALGPAALIFLFALFGNLDRTLRADLVRAEQEFQGLEKEIAAIDNPPAVPHQCRRGDGGEGGEKKARVPGLFQILVPERIWLSEGRPVALPLALVPSDPGVARFLGEELRVSLRRSWTDPSIGTEGLQEVENLWIERPVFREEKTPPRFAEEIAPLARGEPVWKYDLPIEGASEKPGLYTIEARIRGHYPLPMLGMRGAYSWQEGNFRCEAARFEVKAPADTEALRAVLSTQREGKEAGLRALRRHARFTRAAKYGSAAALLALLLLIGYRFFVPLEEETPIL